MIVQFEMETLNIAGEPEDDGAKFHAAKWYPDPKVVYDKPPRRPDVTKSSQPNFGGPAHAGGELITWYQDVSRGPAATKVWEDYENGKPVGFTLFFVCCMWIRLPLSMNCM